MRLAERFYEFFEAVESLFDLVARRRVREPDVIVHAEGRAGNDGDTGLVQATLAKIDTVLKLRLSPFFAEVAADIGEGVKGALRFREVDALHAGKATEHVEAAFIKLGNHGVIDTGICEQSGQSSFLSEGVGATRRVTLKSLDRLRDF